MKIYRFISAAALMAAALIAGAMRPAGFCSTDSVIENTYRWARDMAMSYVRDGSDPVGLWYEAALPGRESFCMRDLSHQTVGAALLGLDAHNLNMLKRVAENVSDSKDWCSYWEIERLNRPTPCDYRNDKEFWYNLPANFDVMRACYGLYEWTGDSSYLVDPVFTDFYRRTAHDYADRWALTPDSIMQRRRFMNTPQPFNRKDGMQTCRGLPSYAENFSGITVAIDLVGALKRGYESYAAVAAHNGDNAEAAFAAQRASAYDDIIENIWWDSANNRYNTYYKENGEFHRGEGLPYMLLICALSRHERVKATVADVLSRDWNVENLSAFPVFLYRLGYPQAADSIISKLPEMKRNDYPEVSYGVIEGIFCGLMGIQPSASRHELATCYNGDDEAVATATDVPMLGGTVTLTHRGHKESTLTNNTPDPIMWKPSFLKSDGSVTVSSVEVAPSATVTISSDDN